MWPTRQRFSQSSFGVMNPGLKLSELMKYFSLHRAGRVDQLALRVVEVVVRERLRHRVHAAVTADAVVQEDAAVATRGAAHVLADAIRRTRRVRELLHVAAHVVDHREAEHRAVGAGDEESGRRGARGDEARGAAVGRAVHGASGVVSTKVGLQVRRRCVSASS